MLSSPKKLCYHDDSFYNFLIRDTDGKLFLRISGGVGGIKLKDFLKEMRKQTKKICVDISVDKAFFFYRNFVGEFVLIHSQLELEKTLEITKYFGSMPLYLGISLNKKIAEIFAECEQCRNKKKYSNSPMLSNKTNPKSRTKFSSEQSSENVEIVKECIDEKFLGEKCLDEIHHQSIFEPSRIPSSQEKLCNNLHKKQKESKDMKVLSQFNDSSTVPPPWFEEYMKTMKDDMIYKITHEVTKKVTKKMFKHLDLFLQNLPVEQNQPYYISSPLEREPQCSSKSIEKNQGQKKSQDEEQSSDASIERIEEPQNADTAKDVQVTKNERSTVNSKKTIKDISENLITIVPSKKHKKSGNLIKKNHIEIEKQLEHAATVSELNLFPFWEIKRRMQKNAFIDYEIMEEKKNQREAQIRQNFDNLMNDAILQEKPDENSFTANPKVRPIKSADWKPGKIENGFHMSCSVTGHQMLDENQQNIKDLLSGRCSDALDDALQDDVDKISFCSCNQEENDDDTFEIIEIPPEKNDSFTRHKEPVAEQEGRNSSRDSPSFELVTEPSSPCSIYITEDHFAANEGKSDEEDPRSNNNNNSTSCGGYQPEFDEPVKSMDADLEKRSGGAYSFVTETLPAQDFNSFSKSLRAKQRSNEGKYSRDDGRSLPEDTCGLYDDVRSSHTSYLTVQTHCDCLSQCANLGDLTQSFHSHTTSINDMTDVSHRLVNTDNSHSSQMPSTDAQDAAAIPKSSVDPHVDNDRVKNAKMNEMHDADNYPKCRVSTPQDVFTDTPHQYHRANGLPDKSSPYAGSGKTFAAEQPGTADSVHILPETLVIAAAQVGSFAYDTAREVFDKIRAHAKEDSTKRRSGTKSDHKKPFGNLPFI
ncbi:uncharacterized protein [Linepithema humile]|uniref:uncharacterized protein n=1 Tax=Linepithema humile TaxID=83485 RepID=UPI0006232FEB|nr:PREDICTED: uncharacterized protein LOC105672033 [Linepithema humile]XP_012222122.1 PREDICTED: uncharacterized protein LOC105672033 [Linepithema humile]